MAEKFLVTNYDRDEFVSLIKEAFEEELKGILTMQEKERVTEAGDGFCSSLIISALLIVSIYTQGRYSILAL